MADIELVIKIPEEVKNRLCFGVTYPKDIQVVCEALNDGTPLSKGHGRLIDADALEKKMCDREEELGDDRALWESSAASVALDMFAPTIIEADEAESEE